MSRIIIYPYRFASASARALVENVRSRGYNCLRVHPDRKYTKKAGDLVINWGAHTAPKWDSSDILNPVEAVRLAGDKLKTLEHLSAAGVETLEFTSSPERANSWLQADGAVVERQLLNASGGRGIVLHDDPSSKVGEAPLYTRYFKKKLEYRVHVANGEVIDWQQKMVKKDSDKEINYQIRNHANGWIFARDAAKDIPAPLITSSIRAVNSLGLVFGAVDCGWNEHYSYGVVFEVNTAPGLEGDTTVQAYTNFVIDNYEDRN